MAEHLLGVDTGGTFTDFVHLFRGRITVHKVLSTPDDPANAIIRGVNEMGLLGIAQQGNLRLVHGTTVATNAVLEGKGADTVYVTNEGLKDVLNIGRQTRKNLYRFRVEKASMNIQPDHCVEVAGRIDAAGTEIQSLTPEDLLRLVERIKKLAPQAIAINLLFSFLNDLHERQIELALKDHYFVSRSSSVLPEYKEYERGVCTYINASLGPLMADYLLSLAKSLRPNPVSIMQSSGVTIAAEHAATRAINLLLSGPVGGLKAAQFVAGPKKLMTFDMGGTSTDVALLDGDIGLTRDATIAGLPISVPMADIHTIGAGGGSIAFMDAGGLLNVGPGSAGASPGPACYGRGGLKPTVTDANLALGRLHPDHFLDGALQLDIEAAIKSVSLLANQLGVTMMEAAQGIISLANEHMAQALRMISIERGHDPRQFVLLCFGGAGGLHVCALADALEITRAMVPVHGGVFSALGMLVANPGREMTRTHRRNLANLDEAELEQVIQEMTDTGISELTAEGITDVQSSVSLDLRYVGQTFTLTLPRVAGEDLIEAFNQAHLLRYGHKLSKPVELVNIRIHLEATAPDLQLIAESSNPTGEEQYIEMVGVGRGRLIKRQQIKPGLTLSGPLLVTEPHATTLVQSGWDLTADKTGNLMLERVQ